MTLTSNSSRGAAVGGNPRSRSASSTFSRTVGKSAIAASLRAASMAPTSSAPGESDLTAMTSPRAGIASATQLNTKMMVSLYMVSGLKVDGIGLHGDNGNAAARRPGQQDQRQPQP